MTVNPIARASSGAADNTRVTPGLLPTVSPNRSLIRQVVLGSWLPVALVLLTLTGWLHIIWDGEPRFMLIDDRGGATRLMIDPVLARRFGGPRSLNQKRVTVTGERVSDQPETVHVVSIELAPEGQ